MDIAEDDAIYMDTCVAVADDTISEEEDAVLFFIAGYVTHKWKPLTPGASTFTTTASEFTSLLSRGRLSYPPEELFQYVRLCYALFNTFPNAEARFRCVTYISKLFFFFYSSLYFEIDSTLLKIAISTIINCFFKGITKMEDSSDSSNNVDRKLRKICN